MAASSLRIACGGSNREIGMQKRCNSNLIRALPPSLIAVGGRNQRSAVRKGRLSAATVRVRGQGSLVSSRKRERGAKDAVEAQERLDRWMRDSVGEIVKNLREAPLLVQVFSERAPVAMEKKVVVEDWAAVKERWEAGEAPMPEGVIFVEELDEEEAAASTERTTRVWGVVVQGKGVGSGPVCYLLKTSQAGSGPGPGMGILSTHFCLIRVKSFRESARSQLKNCWLLQSQWQQH